MKRVLISLGLLTASLCASLFETAYVGSKTDSCIAQIKEIDRMTESGKTSQALEKCRSLGIEWESELKKINVLLIHDYADSVGAGIAKMLVHLENSNADMYFSESANAKKGLASIKGSEYPFIENIL